MPVRVRPDTRVCVQGDCRRERAPLCGARQRRRHKALERESPQGAQPTGIPAGVETRFILARNGCSRCGERPHARNGRSRAKRPASKRRAEAASGACRNIEPVQPGSTLSDTAALLVDSERARSSRSPGDSVSRAHGAKRRERPPTPQAPQGRGAQRGSRDAERPRAFTLYVPVSTESAECCKIPKSFIYQFARMQQHAHRRRGSRPYSPPR